MGQLGLSALALLAMSAFVASGAQAQHEVTNNYEFTCLEDHEDPDSHVHCDGHGEQTEPHVYNAGLFAELKCETAEFDVTTDADGTSTEAPTTPTYEECESAFPVRTVHVDHNGCEYKFHIESKIDTDIYEGSAEIANCGATKSITVTVTNSSETGVQCTIHIPEQTTIKPIRFIQETGTPTAILVNAEHAIVNASFTGSFFSCGVSEGEHETEYTGPTTVESKDTNGDSIDAVISPAEDHS